MRQLMRVAATAASGRHARVLWPPVKAAPRALVRVPCVEGAGRQRSPTRGSQVGLADLTTTRLQAEIDWRSTPFERVLRLRGGSQRWQRVGADLAVAGGHAEAGRSDCGGLGGRACAAVGVCGVFRLICRIWQLYLAISRYVYVV